MMVPSIILPCSVRGNEEDAAADGEKQDIDGGGHPQQEGDVEVHSGQLPHHSQYKPSRSTRRRQSAKQRAGVFRMSLPRVTKSPPLQQQQRNATTPKSSMSVGNSTVANSPVAPPPAHAASVSRRRMHTQVEFQEDEGGHNHVQSEQHHEQHRPQPQHTDDLRMMSLSTHAVVASTTLSPSFAADINAASQANYSNIAVTNHMNHNLTTAGGGSKTLDRNVFLTLRCEHAATNSGAGCPMMGQPHGQGQRYNNRREDGEDAEEEEMLTSVTTPVEREGVVASGLTTEATICSGAYMLPAAFQPDTPMTVCQGDDVVPSFSSTCAPRSTGGVAAGHEGPTMLSRHQSPPPLRITLLLTSIELLEEELLFMSTVSHSAGMRLTGHGAPSSSTGLGSHHVRGGGGSSGGLRTCTSTSRWNRQNNNKSTTNVGGGPVAASRCRCHRRGAFVRTQPIVGGDVGTRRDNDGDEEDVIQIAFTDEEWTEVLAVAGQAQQQSAIAPSPIPEAISNHPSPAYRSIRRVFVAIETHAPHHLANSQHTSLSLLPFAGTNHTLRRLALDEPESALLSSPPLAATRGGPASSMFSIEMMGHHATSGEANIGAGLSSPTWANSPSTANNRGRNFSTTVLYELQLRPARQAPDEGLLSAPSFPDSSVVAPHAAVSASNVISSMTTSSPTTPAPPHFTVMTRGGSLTSTPQLQQQPHRTWPSLDSVADDYANAEYPTTQRPQQLPQNSIPAAATTVIPRMSVADDAASVVPVSSGGAVATVRRIPSSTTMRLSAPLPVDAEIDASWLSAEGTTTTNHSRENSSLLFPLVGSRLSSPQYLNSTVLFEVPDMLRRAQHVVQHVDPAPADLAPAHTDTDKSHHFNHDDHPVQEGPVALMSDGSSAVFSAEHNMDARGGDDEDTTTTRTLTSSPLHISPSSKGGRGGNGRFELLGEAGGAGGRDDGRDEYESVITPPSPPRPPNLATLQPLEVQRSRREAAVALASTTTELPASVTKRAKLEPTIAILTSLSVQELQQQQRSVQQQQQRWRRSATSLRIAVHHGRQESLTFPHSTLLAPQSQLAAGGGGGSANFYASGSSDFWQPQLSSGQYSSGQYSSGQFVIAAPSMVVGGEAQPSSCPPPRLIANVDVQLSHFRFGHRVYHAESVFAVHDDDDDDDYFYGGGVGHQQQHDLLMLQHRQQQQQQQPLEGTTSTVPPPAPYHYYVPRCTICYQNSANVILLPCHHLGFCVSCVRRVTHCPVCRKHIEHTLYLLEDVV